MNVAEAFPARVQPDGRVYRRPVDHDGKLGDGWTDNPDLAHPDYFAPGAPAPIGTTTTEENAVTALTEDFAPAQRFTEWMRYPLPPETPRPKSKFNGWGWYQLPDPETGRPTGFARATTIAKTLDDREGLSKWSRRQTALRVYQLTQMDPDAKLSPHFDTTAGQALEQLVHASEQPKVTALDQVLEVIDNLLGGADARELGECVHAWLEAIDMGIVLLRDVPEVVRPHVDAYLKVMKHRGLVPLPEYVERTVLNDQGEETVAGKIDRIFRIVTTGELVLGDVKTSKDLQYSWLTFGVQVGGVYGWATKVLTLDGKGWEPMPELRDDFAVLMHIPSDQPRQAAAITIDLLWGAETMVASLDARQRRKMAKVEVPKHAMPAPSDGALRYVEARYALSGITTLDEGEGVYETYQDVWDDDLGQHAERIAELLD